MNVADQTLYIDVSKVAPIVKVICERLKCPTIMQKYYLTRSLERLMKIDNARTYLFTKVAFAWNRAPNSASALIYQNMCDEIVTTKTPALIEEYQKEKKRVLVDSSAFLYTEMLVGLDALENRTRQQLGFCERFTHEIKELQERKMNNLIKFQELAVDKIETLYKNQVELQEKLLKLIGTFLLIIQKTYGYDIEPSDKRAIKSSYKAMLDKVVEENGFLMQTENLAENCNELKSKSLPIKYNINHKLLNNLAETILKQKLEIDSILNRLKTVK